MADLVAMAVHLPDWYSLLQMNSSALYEALDSKSLRESRTAGYSFLERRYDIDVESELLDWLDRIVVSDDSTILELTSERFAEAGDGEWLADGLWLLAEWCSAGEIRFMEGRGFLYLEPFTESSMSGVSLLYEEETWRVASENMLRSTKKEYTEAVVLDWMSRREELGETLDEKEDPHVLPTMESHSRITDSLYQMMGLISQGEYGVFAKREWSTSMNSGFGKDNIASLLAKGVIVS